MSKIQFTLKSILWACSCSSGRLLPFSASMLSVNFPSNLLMLCLLYTSDAADDYRGVDHGGQITVPGGDPGDADRFSGTGKGPD